MKQETQNRQGLAQIPEKLGATAQRALANKGISNLQQLAGFTEKDILQLHGMGRSALLKLKASLAEKNLTFKRNHATMATATNVDEYITSFPPATQKKLRQLRSLVRRQAPSAAESISYGIAAYKLNSSPLVYFAGFKNHVGLYPAPVANPEFIHELAAYKSGKGSVQFPLEKPLPLDMVKKIIAFRLQENELNAKTKKIAKMAPATTGIEPEKKSASVKKTIDRGAKK